MFDFGLDMDPEVWLMFNFVLDQGMRLMSRSQLDMNSDCRLMSNSELDMGPRNSLSLSYPMRSQHLGWNNSVRAKPSLSESFSVNPCEVRRVADAPRME